MLELSVLTFNVWMLPLPGTRRRQRLARIVDALRELDADVIAIQEAFDPVARRALVEGLANRYEANQGALEIRRAMGLLTVDHQGGKLILSKLPLRHTSFLAHPLPVGAKVPERVGLKGLLRSTIETPVGHLDFLNVHFYAGGNPRDRAVRSMQLHHFSRMLGAQTDADTLIVAGDFNAWFENGRPVEERTQPEYRFLRKIGLSDAASGDGSATPITYDVDRNPLAAFWSSKKQGGQEFDSIFYRSSAKHAVEVQSASVVLDQKEKPLSDHYGYLAKLRVRSVAG